ncbi:immunity protein (plasmid) [Lactiplantibacillus plantarum]|nr:immunity protein [Lactiplantibacillus plantarum]
MKNLDMLVRVITIIVLLATIIAFFFQGLSTITYVCAIITVILSFVYQLIKRHTD